MNKKLIIQYIGISFILLGSSFLLVPPLFMPKDYPKSIKDTINKNQNQKISIRLLLSGSVCLFISNN